MVGEWLTATANTNMFTYEIAPVFILMENVVLGRMREIIGWNCGDSILAPGMIKMYRFLLSKNIIFITLIFGKIIKRRLHLIGDSIK